MPMMKKSRQGERRQGRKARRERSQRGDDLVSRGEGEPVTPEAIHDSDGSSPSSTDPSSSGGSPFVSAGMTDMPHLHTTDRVPHEGSCRDPCCNVLDASPLSRFQKKERKKKPSSSPAAASSPTNIPKGERWWEAFYSKMDGDAIHFRS